MKGIAKVSMEESYSLKGYIPQRSTLTVLLVASQTEKDDWRLFDFKPITASELKLFREFDRLETRYYKLLKKLKSRPGVDSQKLDQYLLDTQKALRRHLDRRKK